MTKQEEIELQIKARLDIAYGTGLHGEVCDTGELAKDALSCLHSQGVVIKRDYTLKYSTSIPAGTELVAVEPLIEEEK